MEKHCNKCNTTKPVEEFYKNRSTKDGYTNSCGKCREEYSKQYKEKNNERYLELKKEESRRYYNRYKEDPLFQVKRRLRNRIYHYINQYNKSKKTEEILGCNFEELKAYLESKFTEDMSWNKIGEIHIDHIIPLSSANTKEELFKLNHYTNLQPLWAKDNLIKSNKMLF